MFTKSFTTKGTPVRSLLILAAATLIPGCGTITNIVNGPAPYGGFRVDLAALSQRGDLSTVLVVYDLPFSFVLDTALLPFTLLVALIREATGWPRSDHRLGPVAPPPAELPGVTWELARWRASDHGGLDATKRLARQSAEPLKEAGLSKWWVHAEDDIVTLNYGVYYGEGDSGEDSGRLRGITDGTGQRPFKSAFLRRWR